MFYLVDNKRKIMICWTPKCGCSHVKRIFWFLQNGRINNVVHTKRDLCPLPNDIENFTTIVICRNPYNRIVSGFLDKYNKVNGPLRKLWKNKTLSFSLFVEEVIKRNWEVIDKNHFEPQTEGNFDSNILKSKTIKFFDLKNIDYKYLEELYGVVLPSELLNKKQGHERKVYPKNFDKYVYDLDMPVYFTHNVELKYFYNEEIKNKIYEFFKKDFDLFNENGIDYTLVDF